MGGYGLNAVQNGNTAAYSRISSGFRLSLCQTSLVARRDHGCVPAQELRAKPCRPLRILVV